MKEPEKPTEAEGTEGEEVVEGAEVCRKGDGEKTTPEGEKEGDDKKTAEKKPVEENNRSN